MLDIFRFTFYWTFIFYTPFFVACGLFAFFNYTIPPNWPSSKASLTYLDQPDEEDSTLDHERPSSRRNFSAHVPLRILRSRRPRLPSSEIGPNSPRSPLVEVAKKNERRSRLTFGILVFLTFLAVGLAGAVIGSAVLGFVVMGLYRAGSFNMSTLVF